MKCTWKRCQRSIFVIFYSVTIHLIGTYLNVLNTRKGIEMSADLQKMYYKVFTTGFK